MSYRHLHERPRSRRTFVVAALLGLSLLVSAGAADAHPRHKHKHKHRHGKHCNHAVVVHEPYHGHYAPVYAAPCGPGYREVWRPGYWQYHEASHVNVWVPGVMVAVRF